MAALLTLSGCGAEPIKDHLACGDEGKFGAVCVHTLFTQIKPVHISKADWDAMRIGMISFSASDVSDIQKTVDDLCSKHAGACDYQAYQAATAAMGVLKQHMQDHADRFR